MEKKKKILIIEDEKELAFFMKLNLEFTGEYEVSIAHDGEEGLNKATQESPHIVILDLRLPKLSGEEVCKEIRRNEKLTSIPIIMVTGKCSDADRVIGKVIGANSYIPKPFKLEDLLNEINKIKNNTI